jgi:acyl carrier protein phosphodiesterase
MNAFNLAAAQAEYILQHNLGDGADFARHIAESDVASAGEFQVVADAWVKNRMVTKLSAAWGIPESEPEYKPIAIVPHPQAMAALFRIEQWLQEEKVDDVTRDKLRRWFHANSRDWQRFSSQSEFNAYACKRIADKMRRLQKSPKHIAEMSIADLWKQAREATTDVTEPDGRIIDTEAFTSVEMVERVVALIAGLCPPEPMPKVITNEAERTILVDMNPKILIADEEFLSTLKRLSPFRLDSHKTHVVKVIPGSDGTKREFRLVALRFWQLHPDAGAYELDRGIRFWNGDKLDLRRDNLYSTYRAGKAYEASQDKQVPMEIEGKDDKYDRLVRKTGSLIVESHDDPDAASYSQV